MFVATALHESRYNTIPDTSSHCTHFRPLPPSEIIVIEKRVAMELIVCHEMGQKFSQLVKKPENVNRNLPKTILATNVKVLKSLIKAFICFVS